MAASGRAIRHGASSGHLGHGTSHTASSGHLGHTASRSSLPTDASHHHNPGRTASISGGHGHGRPHDSHHGSPVGRVSHHTAPSATSPRSSTNHHPEEHVAHNKRRSAEPNSPVNKRQNHHRASATEDKSHTAPDQQGALNGDQQVWLAIGRLEQDIKKLKDDQRSDVVSLDDFKSEYQRQLDKDESRWREQRVQNDRLMGMVRMMETETADLRARLKDAKASRKNAAAYSTHCSALHSVQASRLPSRGPSRGGDCSRTEEAHKVPSMDEVLSGVTAAARSLRPAEGGEEDSLSPRSARIRLDRSPNPSTPQSRSTLGRAATLPSITCPSPSQDAPDAASGLSARGAQTARRRSQQALSLTVLHEGHSPEDHGAPHSPEDHGLSFFPPAAKEASESRSAVLHNQEEAIFSGSEEQHDEEEAIGPARELEFSMVQSAEEVSGEEHLRPSENEDSRIFEKETPHREKGRFNREEDDAKESWQEGPLDCKLVGEEAAAAVWEEESDDAREDPVEEEWDCCESRESSAPGQSSSSSSSSEVDAFDHCDGDDQARQNAGEVLANWNSSDRSGCHHDHNQRIVDVALDCEKLAAQEEDQFKAALIIQRIWRFGARRFDLSSITGKQTAWHQSQAEREAPGIGQPLRSDSASPTLPPRSVPRMERRRTLTSQQLNSMRETDDDGKTTMQMASGALLEAVEAANEELSMVLLLTANSRMLNQVDTMGRTPLHVAARNGMSKVCDALLRNKNFESADTVHVGGWTALHVAARQGRTNVVKVILKSDRFHAVNSEDDNGRTALHAAAVNGSLEVVRAILEHPGFTAIDLQNFGGFTAQHVAERHGHAEVCKLISKFSDETSRNRATMAPGSCRSRRATASRRKTKPDLEMTQSAKKTIDAGWNAVRKVSGTESG